MWVPYDADRMRRTIRFIMRSQLRSIRILGGLLVVVGLGLVALRPANPFLYALVVFGVVTAVVFPPITVAQAARMQSSSVKDGGHLTLDEEWLSASYPFFESRLRWAGLDSVIETPEVWYAMFGRTQAVAIPKDTMTEPERAEFAAFVKGLQFVRR